MIFENMWPLFFLGAIPIIILLYLLKPRGKDYDISSNLLWKKIVQNQHSKTYFEKFTHNILMYLQILAVILLAVTLMSPYITTTSHKDNRKILVIDTSASMNNKNAKGNTRFQDGINDVISYLKATDQLSLTVITCSGKDTQILAVDVTDKNAIYDMLHSLSPTDETGDLYNAKSVIDQIISLEENPDYVPNLMFLTDGDGASSIEQFTNINLSKVFLMDYGTSNVSNDYMALQETDHGTYDILVSTTNYSDSEVSFDVTLLDGDGNFIQINHQQLSPNENGLCIFSDIDLKTASCQSSLSGFSFADNSYDSLDNDNLSYALKSKSANINGLLVSESNTFIEKAYLAITGDAINKGTVATDNDYSFIIYDKGYENTTPLANTLTIHSAKGSTGELKNVMLSFAGCDLSAGLKDFSVGVNSTYTYTLPTWATPLIECNSECVAYYGDHDGIREVVIGFDIRESDFPLHGEFPVFIANTINYLNNATLLSTNMYYAGDKLVINPWAYDSLQSVTDDCKYSGLYNVTTEDMTEEYIVRFPTTVESDPRISHPGFQTGEKNGFAIVKKTLRTIFLILAFLFIVIEFLVYRHQMRYKGKFYYFTRAAILLLLFLAVLDLHVPMKSTKTTTIFLVDLSNSNEENLDDINSYLSKTIRKMPAKNQFGIICFGKNGIVEQFLTSDNEYKGLMSLPQKNSTNFEDAIQKAVAMIPGGNTGRLVLITDGKETKGNIFNLAPLLSGDNLELLSLKYETEVQDDAYIDNVILPSYLHLNDVYSITVIIESNFETDAVLDLYRASILEGSNTVHLNKGTNRFVLQQTVTDEHIENLRVQITPTGDSCADNNVYNAYANVEAPPQILIVQGGKSSTQNLINIMTASNIDYSIVNTRNAPKTLDDMLKYKTIVMVDSTYRELPYGFTDNIESYVKDFGNGLVCIGGTHSYALGGYRDTIFDEILPVSMVPENENLHADMCMVMVIDCSGSMSASLSNGGTDKLSAAIQSALVAVDNLSATDYVGVLVFDDGFNWQVPIQQKGDGADICAEIEQINRGGGTNIKPAVEEAFHQITTQETTLKHIVLLTDGQDGSTNYDELTKKMQRNGVSLSTVAVGGDSDTYLLEVLAEEGGGRYYFVDNDVDLPNIFAQEVFLGGGAFLQEGTFPPTVRTSHQLTTDLYRDGWPTLYGYIGTSPKSSASVLITAGEKNDPILAVRNHGLGKTIAWTSDLSGEWTRDYSASNDNAQLWKRILEYAAGNSSLGEDNYSIIQSGDQAFISYEAKEFSSDTHIYANVVAPDGETQEFLLRASAPGKYEATIDASDYGLYHINIRKEVDDEIVSSITNATAVQYSDEYKYDISSANYDKFIEQYGSSITEDTPIWNKLKFKNTEKKSLLNLLTILGLLFFLMDVALRRFQFEPKPLRLPEKKTRNKKLPKETTVAVPSNDGETTDSNMVHDQTEPKEIKKKKPKKEKKKQEEETLDTSILLKKKDDRNI